MSTIDFITNGAGALTEWDADKAYWKEALLIQDPPSVQVLTLSDEDRLGKQAFWRNQHEIAAFSSAGAAIAIFAHASIIFGIALTIFSYLAFLRAIEAASQIRKWQALPSLWLEENRHKALEEGFFYSLEHHLKGSYIMPLPLGILHPHEIEQQWQESLALWKERAQRPIENKGQWVDHFTLYNPLSKEAFNYAFPEGNPAYQTACEAFEALKEQILPIQNDYLQKQLSFERAASAQIREILSHIPRFFVLYHPDGQGRLKTQYIPNGRYFSKERELYAWKAAELLKIEEEKYKALEPYFDQTITLFTQILD